MDKKEIYFFFCLALKSGAQVIARGCPEVLGITEEDCERAPNDIRVKHCELCYTEGCNGAAEYGPITLFVIIPVAITWVLMSWHPFEQLI